MRFIDRAMPFLIILCAVWGVYWVCVALFQMVAA